jgi:hypothetical protein
VAEGVETLSDHLYILMEVAPESTPAMQACGTRGAFRSRPPPRWRLKERNKELLLAAVTAAAWSWDARRTQGSVDEEAKSLREDMSAACDASMPRSVPGSSRFHRAVHWWTQEIAALRTRCVQARRVFQRARRRRIHSEEEISRCYEVYRETRRALQREIKNAKARSWRDLVQAVESDPWGRPYRIVTKKLRPSAPPLTTNMDPALLANVIGTLFPRQEDDDARETPPSSIETREWSGELEVTDGELLDATKRMASRDVALGPDGVPGRV